MLVQLLSADRRVDVEDVFDLDVFEDMTETVSSNNEYVMLAEVSSLDEVYEASQQGRIIVQEPLSFHHDDADVVVTEYNDYVE